VKFNYLGIFQSLKLRISMKKVLSVSLKLNFTPNTSGSYGFTENDFRTRPLFWLTAGYLQLFDSKRVIRHHGPSKSCCDYVLILTRKKMRGFGWRYTRTYTNLSSKLMQDNTETQGHLACLIGRHTTCAYFDKLVSLPKKATIPWNYHSI